jgi:mannose-6-phosphate isomerase-like protein (cupin superfamily)
MDEQSSWNLDALVSLDHGKSIWKLFSFIGQEERHFNSLQAKYRVLASGWLLAAFSGIGFVVSKTFSINVPSEILIAGIALAGAIGIYLLWVVDILVYHRLLDSCFVEGLKLERQVRSLPPFRHNMMKTQQRRGVLSSVIGFYQGPIMLLILIFGGSLTFYFRNNNLVVPFCMSVATGFLALAGGFFIYSRTDNTAFFEESLGQDSRPKEGEQHNQNRSPTVRAYASDCVIPVGVVLTVTALLALVVAFEAPARGTLSAVSLPSDPNYVAPDGSEVRLLTSGSRGSMAYFSLSSGEASGAVAHHSVEELWYFTRGQGEMWRRLGAQEEVTRVAVGMSVNIPPGTHFQFRSTGKEPLEAVGVTMPPWPGSNEAYPVAAKWPNTK